MAIRINGVDYTTTRDSKSGVDTHNKLGASESTGVKLNKNAHGTYHIADNTNMYEIQRTNNFEFIVYFGEDMLEAGLTIDSKGSTIGADYAQEVIRMSVSQAFIPHFTQEAIPVKRGNSTLKYAGVPNFDNGSITLNDYIGADTKAALMAWQNLSYNVATEKVGLASDYKKKAHLIEYSPDLQQVRSWTLYGCWVSSISETDYNSDDNSKHTITVQITYDKAILDADI